MSDLSQYKDVLTVKDIMEILQIGRNSAYKLVNSGSFRILKIGKQIRIPKASLEKYLNGDYDNNISEIAIKKGGISVER